jgi:hypothetical protein
MKKLWILLALIITVLGCATNVHYARYTDQTFRPKPKYYPITVYPREERPSAAEPHTIIGRVDISGEVEDGVTPDTLLDRAKEIARKKGADAIIGAKTEQVQYNGVYVEEQYHHGRYDHRLHYLGPAYIPYTNTLLRFRGELIVFTGNRPDVIPDQ